MKRELGNQAFIGAINALGTITSIKGKTYENIRVQNGKVWFVRGSTGNTESISLDELYELYKNEQHISTTIARSYISGRVQSPAVAILRSLEAGDNRSSTASVDMPIHLPKDSEIPRSEVSSAAHKSDETRFFNTLATVLGTRYVKSKNLFKPVTGQDVFLYPNYRAYEFDEKIERAYEQILEALMSSGKFSSQSLAHHIDGLILNHPAYGSRIVEFDEEQHFTPARRDALQVLGKYVSLPYIAPFEKICNDINYLQYEVLRKHRIRSRLGEVPATFRVFIRWLKDSGTSESGYIKPKNGFEYLGGRIAQRAYYDCLRDTAHLSPKNQLEAPIRFAKKSFEDTFNKPFARLTASELETHIQNELNNLLN